MSIRSKSLQGRCNDCGLHTRLCLCAELPTVTLKTRIVVVQHAIERFKPTSTAPLLLNMFPNSALLIYGARDVRFDVEEIERDVAGSCLLFPSTNAPPLLSPAEATDPPPSRLVVLDGTWSQCSRMARRVPVVSALPQRKLPAGGLSHWTVRRTQNPTRLCTFEAVLRAISILEGPSSGLSAAEHSFQRVTARALYMRSRLPAPEVPDDWQLHLRQ